MICFFVVACTSTSSLRHPQNDNNPTGNGNVGSGGIKDFKPVCRLYTEGRDPQDMKLVSEGLTKGSEAFSRAAGVNSPTNVKRYQLKNLSVEIGESAGCAMECWSTRHILVTQDGVSTYTSGEIKGLNSESQNAAFYPSLSFIKRRGRGWCGPTTRPYTCSSRTGSSERLIIRDDPTRSVGRPWSQVQE